VTAPVTGESAFGRGGRLDPDRLAALEEQRDFLLTSLEDLDRELAAGDLDPDDHTTLHAEYTARAAAVLRSISAGEARLAATRASGRRRPVNRIVVMAAIVLAALGLGWAVAQSAGERAPGDVASGSIRESSNDLLARARLAMASGEAVTAVERFDEVLALDPTNREALAYKGWLLVLAGLVEEGRALVNEAVATDPDYPDARFFRAFIRFRHDDDIAGALDDARIFLVNDPPPSMVPEVAALVEELERLSSQPAGADDSDQSGGGGK